MSMYKKGNVMHLENFFQSKSEEAHKAAALNMAWMNTKLCVPLITKDVMDNPTSLDDETVFGLHDMISDFEIDTALLAIASGALQIIRTSGANVPALHVLAIECERIICEYGDEWIKQNNTAEPDFDYMLSILPHLPEDLESIGDLIGMALTVLPQDGAAHQLLDILNVQADAHMMIAEEFVSALDAQPSIETPVQTVIAANVASESASNIIAFRAR